MDEEKGKVRTFVEGYKTAILSGVGIVIGVTGIILGCKSYTERKKIANVGEKLLKFCDEVAIIPDNTVNVFKADRGHDNTLILDAGEKLVEAIKFTNVDNPSETYVLQAIKGTYEMK